VWTKAFWRPRGDAPEGELADSAPSALIDESFDIDFAKRADVGRMPVFMLIPTGALIAVGLALMVFAGPIIGYSDRTAVDLEDRSIYIDAVLGPGYTEQVDAVGGEP
jgi:multicomponent Na+:H+ antiporter subunit D